MSNICIETDSLRVGYGENIVVPEFNIAIQKSKITSVIGANGCGKSTVLKAIGRILPSKEGTVYLDGQDINAMKGREIARKLAVLPQMPSAPETLTVEELVAYGRFPYQSGFGRASKEDKEAIEKALKLARLEDLKDRELSELSGGQRQRVWIALALAQQTNIILLDEPTTYLDLAHQLDVLELLKHLNELYNTTIVMVLHDLNLASRYSDMMIAMKDGEIAFYGTPDQVMTEETLRLCFGIDARLMHDEKSGKPLIFSYEISENSEIFFKEREN